MRRELDARHQAGSAGEKSIDDFLPDLPNDLTPEQAVELKAVLDTKAQYLDEAMQQLRDVRHTMLHLDFEELRLPLAAAIRRLQDQQKQLRTMGKR